MFQSYHERHASDVGGDLDDDRRRTNRQRRRQIPTVLAIEQKVEIGMHESEMAYKDVSECTNDGSATNKPHPVRLTL